MARPRPITIGKLVNIDGSLTMKPAGVLVELPDDFITQTSAILATKRSGKSNAGVVIAEELYRRKLPFVTIDIKGDWWGMRAMGTDQMGLDIPIFGGKHGDIQLDPSAGKMFAHLVSSQRLTCIIDVSRMENADRNKFLKDFINELYLINEEPLLVILEEAEQVAPQLIEKSEGNAPALLGAINRMIKMGGQKGLGVLLLSQRSGSLNKNSLSQIETLIILRTAHQLDRKAVSDWVSNLDADSGYDIATRMRVLTNGQAFIVSPYFLPTFADAPPVQLVQFRMRHTFDSGATPKVGEARPAARMADIDLEAISAEMAEAIATIKRNDPEALRKELNLLRADMLRRNQHITELEAEVEAKPVDVKVMEVPVLTGTDMEMLSKIELAFQAGIDQATSYRGALNDLMVRLESIELNTRNPVRPRTPPRPPDSVMYKPKEPLPQSENLVLPKGAQRMVETLGRLHPLKATTSQWGLAAKLRHTGGTWGTYLSKIRSAGLIEESGGLYTLSPLGFAHIGGVPEALTAAELQDQVRSSLGRNSGAARMLDALLQRHPHGLDRVSLGEAANIEPSGGSFGTYLSKLRANGIIRESGSVIFATEFIVYGPGVI